MITNNYKAILNSFLFNSGSSSAKYGKSVIDENNNNVYTAFNSSNGWISNIYSPTLKTSGTTANCVIGFGEGNTEEAATDYKLETPIYTLSMIGSIGHSLSINNGLITVQNIITVKNTSSSEITIKEMGLYVRIPTISTLGATGSATQRYILIDRVVLDTPITLAPDESAAFTYNISEVAEEVEEQQEGAGE